MILKLYKSKKLRLKIIFILIIFLLICTNYYFVINIKKSYTGYKFSPVALGLLITNEIKYDIKNQKEVCYISSSNSNDVFRDLHLAERFIIIEYFLAPTYIYNDINCKYIIGDFPDKLPDNKFFKNNNLEIIKKYKYKIYLIKNKFYNPKYKIKRDESNMVL